MVAVVRFPTDGTIALGVLTMKTMMAVLFAFWLSGCDPTNYEDCRKAAAKMPSDRGVTVALANCTKTFITDPAEEQRKIDEKLQKSQWEGIINEQAVGADSILTTRAD